MTTTARFIVLWGAPDDPEAFNRHYQEVHIPLARKLPGLGRARRKGNAPGVVRRYCLAFVPPAWPVFGNSTEPATSTSRHAPH